VKSVDIEYKMGIKNIKKVRCLNKKKKVKRICKKNKIEIGKFIISKSNRKNFPLII
jgi:hypothetical protein